MKTGDTVLVTAVVSGDTDTAKQVTDQTVLKTNGGTWRPQGPSAGANAGSGSPTNEYVRFVATLEHRTEPPVRSALVLFRAWR